MNRLITRLILSFASLSLLVTLVPLLQSGPEKPLVSFLGREQSLVLYASFLTIFMLFVLPVVMGRDREGGSVFAWATVAAYVLIFASIPLLFTAYISGVSFRGLVTVGAVCASATGFPLALRRLTGKWAPYLTVLAGAALAFALPGVLLQREAAGLGNPEWLWDLSPLTWLHRVARLRQVPDVWPFLLLALGIWLLALVPLRRGRSAAGTASLLFLLVLPAGGGMVPAVVSLPPQTPTVRVRSLSGGVCREGLRAPFQVAIEGGGEARIKLGVYETTVPADGSPRVVLLIPTADQNHLEVRVGEAVVLEPLPAEVVREGLPLVARLGADAALPQSVRKLLKEVVLDPDILPLPRGALEAFDALVLSRVRFQALSQEARARLREHVALGGRLVLVGAPGDRPLVRRHGLGRILEVPPEDDATWLELGRPLARPTALDTNLIRTFASPRWQEMDLSALILFALVYHAAFLLAFLLPMLLDARKSVVVYLSSVGFVVLAVAVLAYDVLGDIFLKDNQVYTQSITLLVHEGGEEPLLVGRQFLCFASMSEEVRDLRFAPGTDLVPYLDPERGRGCRLDRGPGGEVILRDVHLDRRERKLLVRVDRVAPSPVVLESEKEAGAFELRFREGGEDPFGLREATPEEAFLVERGRWARHFAYEDGRLAPSDPGPPRDGQREVFLRKLLGRFAPPHERFLLVVLRGVRRPDGGDRYLWSRDLSAFLLLPLSSP